jgi:hexulose-6-phosphate isomerase
VTREALPNPLGIYEKALPKDIDWPTRLALAKALDFDFVEMSIDETDERLTRLSWTKAERAAFSAAVREFGIAVPSICLSAHRRFPFGSRDAATRVKARDIMRRAIDLCVDVGIRTIQIAGYDVYYEEIDAGTRERFIEGMQWSVREASKGQVMLAVEVMETAMMNSISRWREFDHLINSPYFCVYPDLGNLTACGNDVDAELRGGIDKIVAIHLKDALRVTDDFPGQFRDVPFGEGCVDFKACFATLADLGYRGPFLMEMWSEKAAEPVVEIATARRWMIEQMRQGGLLTAAA